MTLLILLVLGLFVLQTLLPAAIRYLGAPGGMRNLRVALGPRDDPPAQSRIGARAERALANLQEAMPVYLTLALLNLILQTTGDTATTGATLFLAARAAYAAAYIAGIPVLRTLLWMAGWAGMIMMLLPVLDRA